MKRHVALPLMFSAALFLETAVSAGEIVTHTPPYDALGQIESKDPRFDKLIPPGAKMEKLASGFNWSEGPVWIGSAGVPAGGHLLFSDVPENIVYKWKEGEKVSVFMKPSGYTGAVPRGGEPGSNGLTVDATGRLILCEHGDRRIARLEKDGTKTTLAERYNGKRFNSPNDAVVKSNGDVYFTDPPYGLVKNWGDPAREQDVCGVYRIGLGKGGEGREVTLLTGEMTRPNGLAFSPDEKILYVANSDPAKAVWMAFDVKDDGTLGPGRVFFDATAWAKAGKKGLPDGLKLDKQGNLFATGPGGVCVFAPDGTHLGTLNTGEATANCNWGEDGSVLYITADMHLCRIKTATKGNGW